MTRHSVHQPVDSVVDTRAQVAVAEPSAWIAMGLGVFSGLLALCAVVMLGNRLPADASAGWDAWGDANGQRWFQAFLFCFLPMLVAALVTLAASMRQTDGPRGIVRHRLRQVAGALIMLVAFFMFMGMGVIDGQYRDSNQWGTSLLLPLFLVAGSLVSAAAYLAWGCCWLVLAIAYWQPPAHLVRRPPVARR